MFFKELIPYRKLDPFKYDIFKQRKFLNTGVFAWIIGMLFMCIIIMSLMIVKASSTAAFYQNQTEALRTRNIQSYNPASVDTTTTSTAESDFLYQQQATELLPTNFTHPKSEPLRPPNYRKNKFTEEMLLKIQQQQQQQHEPEQNRTQQQRQQPPHDQPHQDLHAIVGENAYLLERTDDTAHEQPIYGTWRTKARRPQPPPLVAVAPAADDQRNDVDNEHHSTNRQQHHPHHHLYERLPKRASTMTPIRSDLHDQIPRPPRLTTSRHPSMIVRRQYFEGGPINASFRDDQKPKPFHFPYDGPMPEEFKKVEGDRSEVNNIQDILQQLHLGNGAPSKMPQLMMMPTGLHIAGSFKNLKSSGVTNFFRNKRKNKQMQLSFPVPMQLFGGYQAPMFNALAQPHQRIAMDQFFPFKPRSPNDINLLAMHQQFKANRSKNKNKQKKALASSNMMLQHVNQRPFAADPYMQNYPQLFALNVTQKPNMKRVPFKVNLDIYPVMPPTKDYKSSAFTYQEAKIASSSRPPTALRNPFTDYYHFPMLPSAAALSYMGGQPNVYSPFKFPSSVQPSMIVPQSSNMQMTFPDQMQKFAQQHQQQQQQQHQQQQQQQQQQQHQQQQIQQQIQQQQIQQQHQSNQFLFPSSNQQNQFVPVNNMHPASVGTNSNTPNSNSNPKSNQIMVNLNVFPKQKPSTTQPPPSTNPFYTNALNINRNTVNEDIVGPLGLIEPRHLTNNSNATNNQQLQKQQQQPHRIARSDSLDQQPLVDFEHPIVAAEIPELPHSSALINNKLDGSEYSSHYDRIEGRRSNKNHNNFNYNTNANVDQLASEARTASLFRFPVEDLIQFQVDDAL